MPTQLDYYTPGTTVNCRRSEWGLASMIFGIFLLTWITLPIWGISPNRVDVFHNLEAAGPLMGIVGICFAYVGTRQKERNRRVAWLALTLNLLNTLLVSIFWATL